MLNIEVQQGQNMLDVSIEHTGQLDNLFAIALMNGNLSITDSLNPGEVLQVDASLYLIDKRNLAFYDKKNIVPGTVGVSDTAVGGIGFMSIGSTFKVS